MCCGGRIDYVFSIGARGRNRYTRCSANACSKTCRCRNSVDCCAAKLQVIVIKTFNLKATAVFGDQCPRVARVRFGQSCGQGIWANIVIIQINAARDIQRNLFAQGQFRVHCIDQCRQRGAICIDICSRRRILRSRTSIIVVIDIVNKRRFRCVVQNGIR